MDDRQQTPRQSTSYLVLCLYTLPLFAHPAKRPQPNHETRKHVSSCLNLYIYPCQQGRIIFSPKCVFSSFLFCLLFLSCLRPRNSVAQKYKCTWLWLCCQYIYLKRQQPKNKNKKQIWNLSKTGPTELRVQIDTRRPVPARKFSTSLVKGLHAEKLGNLSIDTQRLTNPCQMCGHVEAANQNYNVGSVYHILVLPLEEYRTLIMPERHLLLLLLLCVCHSCIVLFIVPSPFLMCRPKVQRHASTWCRCEAIVLCLACVVSYYRMHT